MKFLILLAVAYPAVAQVAITIRAADHVTIPGSARSIYADVQGTQNLAVDWKVSGGCSLASAKTTGTPQIVTSPAAGGSCAIQMAQPTNEAPNFTSAVSCTVTATSSADSSKSARIVIPVCAPPVFLTTFPTSTVLFKNQYAVIQTDLRGSVETGVNWSITTNPGEAGFLTGGSTNRHAVFSAKAAGVYVLTATSIADPRKKASTTIYVTQHDLPASNTDHTEAIDCSAVGRGAAFEVGPARQYRDLVAVPWNALKPGDTVRIHNDDTTGKSPTTYHQRIALMNGGTASQPIRICGVPDASGVKPIIDGDNGTTRADGDWARGVLEPLAIISFYDAGHKYDATADGQQNIAIEGLHIRNVNANFKFIKQSGGVPAAYAPNAACVRLQTGRGVLIRGNDLDTCSQAVFTNATTPEGGIVYDLTVEGNYIHQWGVPKGSTEHAMYIQAIGVAVQFNYFSAALADVPGNVIKSRSTLNFLRWNFISQTPSTSRAFDLVEPQSYACSVIPYKFAVIYHARNGAKQNCYTTHGGASADPLPPDQVAANFEAYHSDYIYGNTLNDAGSGSGFVHYGYDQQTEDGPAFDRRPGTLFYWNNTHLIRDANGIKQIFDLIAPDQGASYEYATVHSLNNVFATTGAEQYQWTRGLGVRVIVDSNWIAPGYVLPDRTHRDLYQGAVPAADAAGCNQYQRCKPGNGRMVWARDGRVGTVSTLYVGPTPFDPVTFKPSAKLHGLAAHLPKAIQNQPSNMQYVPSTNTIKPRANDSTLGSLD